MDTKRLNGGETNFSFAKVAALMVVRKQLSVEQASTLRATCKDADEHLKNDCGTMISDKSGPIHRSSHLRVDCERCHSSTCDTYPFSSVLEYGHHICSDYWQLDPKLRVISKTLAETKYCLRESDVWNLSHILSYTYSRVIVRERDVQAAAVLRYGSDVKAVAVRVTKARKDLETEVEEAARQAKYVMARREYLFMRLEEEGYTNPRIWGLKAEKFLKGHPFDMYELIAEARSRIVASRPWHLDMLVTACLANPEILIRSKEGKEPKIIKEMHFFQPIRTRLPVARLQPSATSSAARETFGTDVATGIVRGGTTGRVLTSRATAAVSGVSIMTS
jgi:hypothetical protein